jgi:hypothetical protein
LIFPRPKTQDLRPEIWSAYPIWVGGLGGAGAGQAVLWLPSQNGRFADAPQRQRENAVLPVKSYLLPSASTISTTPVGSSMRKGPFGRTVIVTWDMKSPVNEVSFQTIADKKKLPAAT